MSSKITKIKDAVRKRFGDDFQLEDNLEINETLFRILTRSSCRDFKHEQVSNALLNIICAAAFSSPSKSDLQQRDIIIVNSKDKIANIARLIPGQPWIKNVPTLVVFCGNNRRQRLLHEWTNVPFENDHLDSFFNAATDAAIALSTFVVAAEAQGLGCCPISAIRNEATELAKLLSLPNHVFPFAGLALGYPQESSKISKRLPLKVTCHYDQYTENDIKQDIEDYDSLRSNVNEYSSQRLVEKFGTSQNYGWCEDKIRQYSEPERSNFGQYIRSIGFCLD